MTGYYLIRTSVLSWITTVWNCKTRWKNKQNRSKRECVCDNNIVTISQQTYDEAAHFCLITLVQRRVNRKNKFEVECQSIMCSFFHGIRFVIEFECYVIFIFTDFSRFKVQFQFLTNCWHKLLIKYCCCCRRVNCYCATLLIAQIIDTETVVVEASPNSWLAFEKKKRSRTNLLSATWRACDACAILNALFMSRDRFVVNESTTAYQCAMLSPTIKSNSNEWTTHETSLMTFVYINVDIFYIFDLDFWWVTAIFLFSQWNEYWNALIARFDSEYYLWLGATWNFRNRSM